MSAATSPAVAGVSAGPLFDVREVPFSRRGSWLDLSPVIGLHQRADDVHLVSHQTGMHPVLRLVPTIAGERVATALTATPGVLTWTADGAGAGDAATAATGGAAGTVEAAFESVDTVRLRGRGLGLVLADPSSSLTSFTGLYLFRDPIDGSAVLTSYETGRRYRITALSGELDVLGAEALGEATRTVTVAGDEWELVVEELETARPPYRRRRTFDDVVTTSAHDFATYLDQVAPWRDGSTPAAALAAYVMWSATVRPAGFLGREAVLMSKHWMDKVWSWDHCFNALALAPGRPAEALDQLLLPFDHQDASGALPDSVTHSEVLHNFVKPPIHGWAVARLRAALAEPLDAATLRQLYDALVRWTDFWLTSRRVPGHVLPHYQHGNDSGWDNATMFDADRVVEAPDLAAFLVVQLDVLAGLADELRSASQPGATQTGDGAQWAALRDRLAAALVDQLWTGSALVARNPGSGRASSSTSLLPHLALLAADHLPTDVVDAVVEQLDAFLTPWGPATERPDSPQYEADGYWRGPIWAPSTMLLVDGLRRAGRDELADEVSTRFRRLCEAHGFAENFDALTGEGLRDRAYTWTASCYLVLAREAVR
ncbi:amylo-alpha-1,6-glucosidase [Cellulomonas sp. SG140]|uniref:amylo-alpha-1,6-glucosidase n=1 Tax=Cellulomonas sp. SG140 TaxID=2976536 RepID=UPI0021E84648|nr:glycogen debranching protein [Cellulomonas sp. SG140]